MKAFSGYRMMWMQVIFDLPVLTKPQRKSAAQFRKSLLELGFGMEQYSVYFKHLSGREQAETFERKVMSAVPVNGQVSIILITDKQYGSIKSFINKAKIIKKNPDQLCLF